MTSYFPETKPYCVAMKSYLLLFLFLSALSFSGQAQSVIEKDATVTFTFVDDEVNGTMGGFLFTGKLDLNDLSRTVLSGSVQTNTIDTNNWLRSRHLRAKKYFNAKDFPTLSFKSNSLIGNAASFQATGSLSIKGIEKTVIWNFTNDGKTLEGSAILNTTDFDITIHNDKPRNKVIVFLSMPYQ